MRRTLIAVAAATLSLAACKRSSENAQGSGGGRALTVAGSTSVQPFAEKWAEAFHAKKPGVQINIQGGGSTAGVRAAQTGAADVGTASRELKPDEANVKAIVVARDGIAVIVHPGNAVADLTPDQVKGIFTGRIKSWKELGGEEKPLTVITREEGSGTRGAFEELALGKEKIAPAALVQDSTGAVREMVSNDPAAIGYISIGLVNAKVKAVKLGGVEATEANVVAGKYPLVRPFLFLVKGEPAGTTKEFIDFVLSPDGQELVRKEGLIPAK